MLFFLLYEVFLPSVYFFYTLKFAVLGKNTSLLDAFGAANDVLQGAVQGIAELITRPGMINVDFADVRTVMSEKGRAMMGSGRASGEDRARAAAEAAAAPAGPPRPTTRGRRGSRGRCRWRR